MFNGNNISNNLDFDNYLKRLGYKFKNDNVEHAGYLVFRDKKISLAMDIGSSQIKITRKIINLAHYLLKLFQMVKN